MHQNSISAYRAIESELPKSQRRVFNQIAKHWPITRQDIAARLQVPINQVTGRVRELIESGAIEESGDAVADTGKRRALLVPAKREKQLELPL